MYEYRAQAVNVVDGDTIDVVVDLGFHITREIRLRLLHVDTHETHGVAKGTDEYRRGARETEYVKNWLPAGDEDDWPLVIRTEKRGKYGRYLAEVERVSDGAVLNDDLLETFDDIGMEDDS